MPEHDIPAILEAIDIRKAWMLLGFVGTPRLGAQRSPFRDERRPSFSIFANWTKWKDHGTDDHGDVIDFWMKATGKSKGDSIAELAKLAGVAPESADILPARRLKPTVVGQYEPAFVAKLDRKECAYRLETSSFHYQLPLGAWSLKKQITPGTMRRLAHNYECLGLTPQKQLCFFFEHGVKIRGKLEDAHSSFWEEGSRADVPWRMEFVLEKHKTLYVTEGESDHMRILPVVHRHNPDAAVVSMPSASWRPTPAQAFRLGAFRDVILLTDADKAGDAATTALCAILKAEATDCRVWRPRFPEGADCCELGDDFLLKSFDSLKRLV